METVIKDNTKGSSEQGSFNFVIRIIIAIGKLNKKKRTQRGQP